MSPHTLELLTPVLALATVCATLLTGYWIRIKSRQLPSQQEVTALQAELDEVRAALEGVRQELDGRMDELEERTRFTERLLTEATRPR
jgi:uncharacterized membrane-anchored protein YhcB (DUF1043 family)